MTLANVRTPLPPLLEIVPPPTVSVDWTSAVVCSSIPFRALSSTATFSRVVSMTSGPPVRVSVPPPDRFSSTPSCPLPEIDPPLKTMSSTAASPRRSIRTPCRVLPSITVFVTVVEATTVFSEASSTNPRPAELDSTESITSTESRIALSTTVMFRASPSPLPLARLPLDSTESTVTVPRALSCTSTAMPLKELPENWLAPSAPSPMTRSKVASSSATKTKPPPLSAIVLPPPLISNRLSPVAATLTACPSLPMIALLAMRSSTGWSESMSTSRIPSPSLSVMALLVMAPFVRFESSRTISIPSSPLPSIVLLSSKTLVRSLRTALMRTPSSPLPEKPGSVAPIATNWLASVCPSTAVRVPVSVSVSFPFMKPTVTIEPTSSLPSTVLLVPTSSTSKSNWNASPGLKSLKIRLSIWSSSITPPPSSSSPIAS